MLYPIDLLKTLGAYQYVSSLTVIQVFVVSDGFLRLGFRRLCCPAWVSISPDCILDGSSILLSCVSKPLSVTPGTKSIPILGPMACSSPLSCNVPDSFSPSKAFLS